MADLYKTSDGDMVDEICAKYYKPGQLPGAVEYVYSINVGLSALGPVLPGGVVFKLPDIAEPEANPLIRIWGQG